MNCQRTCVVCRKKGDKSNFIKVVFNKNGNIFIKEDKKLEGRGAYICHCPECILKSNKIKALNKAFKSPIPQEFYEELIQKFGTK
mgnify:CR=1 FL=1